ncbi:UBA/THIF-type NAD/FAD binding protein [Candidatus Koribacter versatilis Ellin345]|uniref:Molybdopterin-synthase adenylyltransferase n=1 Tax=Koribacter versatilis (strain Ellin345) TaxID=204669 RepID=Q1IV92_KORVE|nr:molybdopterin-synthase adenylyltransferase MoeB [Candidatus Koribacter versatilis]ABF39208.1 UBA/THIF-type NAD/FAD binding protein [Candidatus Koribacter versatilis Ellin345]
MTLSQPELLRYSRHLSLPEFGLEAQERLKQTKVLCIGTGGLGSPLAMYLAAAGVGTLGLVDFDIVDYTNLQRQIIHTTPDVGRPKVESAAEKIDVLNPFVNVVPINAKLTSANALELFSQYDIIADGTDNFATRYLVNDACVLTGRPNVYASVFRFEGQASVFATKSGPCYRCLYPEPPPPGTVPSCAEGGVLGVLPGLLGIIQATEVIKVACGIGQPLIGRMLLVDASTMKFQELRLKRDYQCPACGTRTLKELIDYDQFCGIRGQESSVAGDITVEELKRRLDAGEKPFILDVREPHEYQIANLGGHLIPLNDLPKRIGELDPTQEIITHCKMGGRSQQAVDFLRQQGFKNAKNLTGGINAWSEKVDPKIPKY